MTKVRISTRAAAFIRAEKTYLARFNKRAAANISRQFRHVARTLSDYPNVGTPVLAQGDVRRFVTPPYIVEYEIHTKELVILIIRHGRQAPDLEKDDGWHMGHEDSLEGSSDVGSPGR
jgi:plasmid stabilization system protein ParE